MNKYEEMYDQDLIDGMYVSDYINDAAFTSVFGDGYDYDNTHYMAQWYTMDGWY